ncbi:MAG TPA: hypothetical protein VGL46_15015 [Pseudonocardiaceae bacterium]|jgi:hypothetical protein
MISRTRSLEKRVPRPQRPLAGRIELGTLAFDVDVDAECAELRGRYAAGD